jgi:hypothetical protein
MGEAQQSLSLKLNKQIMLRSKLFALYQGTTLVVPKRCKTE